MTRIKVEKLEDTLIEKTKVQFLIAGACATMRSKVLGLPRQLVAELRSCGIDTARLHAVRLHLEQRVRRFLCELIVALEGASDPEAALKEIMADDGSASDIDHNVRAEMKHEAVLAKRRAKYATKRKD